MSTRSVLFVVRIVDEADDNDAASTTSAERPKQTSVVTVIDGLDHKRSLAW